MVGSMSEHFYDSVVRCHSEHPGVWLRVVVSCLVLRGNRGAPRKGRSLRSAENGSGRLRRRSVFARKAESRCRDENRAGTSDRREFAGRQAAAAGRGYSGCVGAGTLSLPRRDLLVQLLGPLDSHRNSS